MAKYLTSEQVIEVNKEVLKEINGHATELSFNPKVLQGVRESYYSDKEIKDWLMGGEIREFKRK